MMTEQTTSAEVLLASRMPSGCGWLDQAQEPVASRHTARHCLAVGLAEVTRAVPFIQPRFRTTDDLTSVDFPILL